MIDQQLPPPPAAGGDLADMTLLGLAECGLAGWLLKKPLRVNVICPVGMNPAEDFAVIATGQCLAVLCGNRAWLYRLLRRQKHTARGRHCVHLKTQQPGRFGVGARIRAQGERRRDTLAGIAEIARFRPQHGESYTLRENRDEIEEVVPVIYVQRRPI